MRGVAESFVRSWKPCDSLASASILLLPFHTPPTKPTQPGLRLCQESYSSLRNGGTLHFAETKNEPMETPDVLLKSLASQPTLTSPAATLTSNKSLLLSSGTWFSSDIAFGATSADSQIWGQRYRAQTMSCNAKPNLPPC